MRAVQTEERNFRRGLERAGLGAALTAPTRSLGFFVADLEDELVRALGASAVKP